MSRFESLFFNGILIYTRANEFQIELVFRMSTNTVKLLVTWSAAMQIYWNKWSFLEKDSTTRGWFRTPTWQLPFYWYGKPIWLAWCCARRMLNKVCYRISIVFAFSCRRAKTIWIRYAWMSIFLKTEKKISVLKNIRIRVKGTSKRCNLRD